jgi:hypothetical protein
MDEEELCERLQDGAYPDAEEAYAELAAVPAEGRQHAWSRRLKACFNAHENKYGGVSKYRFAVRTGPRFECALQRSRCRGTTVKGKRCKRSLAQVYGWCAQHARNELGVRVGDSPVAGKGLFATRDIPTNTTVAVYDGECLDDAQKIARYGREGTAPYTVAYVRSPRPGCKYADAACRRSIAAYANQSRANTRLKQAKGQMVLVSTRRIRAGEEIFVNYNNRHMYDVTMQHATGRSRRTR